MGSPSRWGPRSLPTETDERAAAGYPGSVVAPKALALSLTTPVTPGSSVPISEGTALLVFEQPYDTPSDPFVIVGTYGDSQVSIYLGSGGAAYLRAADGWAACLIDPEDQSAPTPQAVLVVDNGDWPSWIDGGSIPESGSGGSSAVYPATPATVSTGGGPAYETETLDLGDLDAGTRVRLFVTGAQVPEGGEVYCILYDYTEDPDHENPYWQFIAGNGNESDTPVNVPDPTPCDWVVPTSLAGHDFRVGVYVGSECSLTVTVNVLTY